MVTRVETAAATRRALLAVAGVLLDAGGPDAVTLREVGARAGVSRSAPYRHFPDKASLLTALATQAWSEVGDALQELAARPDLSPDLLLREALGALVATGRARPHLYRLMFTTPSTDPAAAVRAAERAQDLFLHAVTAVVGPQQAHHYAGLLLTTAHGVTGLEQSGHLAPDKWHATGDDLLELLVSRLPPAA